MHCFITELVRELRIRLARRPGVRWVALASLPARLSTALAVDASTMLALPGSFFFKMWRCNLNFCHELMLRPG